MKLYAYTEDVETELTDLHNGLHHALEQLVNRQDYDKAREIMQTIDQRMANLINQARTVRLG